jgi:hypothetical protein
MASTEHGSAMAANDKKGVELMPQIEGIISSDLIASKIYVIRRLKVMLDRDLAQLYGVETRALNQAVKRNSERFPDDFMIKLNRDEVKRISQFVTSFYIKYEKCP